MKQEEDSLTLQQLARLLIQHRWFIIIFTAGVIAIGGFYFWSRPLEYEAKALFEVIPFLEHQKTSFSQETDFFPPRFPERSIGTQIELIRSDYILSPTVRQLQLKGDLDQRIELLKKSITLDRLDKKGKGQAVVVHLRGNDREQLMTILDTMMNVLQEKETQMKRKAIDALEKTLKQERVILKEELKALPVNTPLQLAMNGDLRGFNKTQSRHDAYDTYDTLSKKIHTLSTLKNDVPINIHILSSARASQNPLPKKIEIKLLSLGFISFLLACFFVIFRDSVRGVAYDPKKISKHYHLPLLAVINSKQSQTSLKSLQTYFYLNAQARDARLVSFLNPKHPTRSMKIGLELASLLSEQANILVVNLIEKTPLLGFTDYLNDQAELNDIFQKNDRASFTQVTIGKSGESLSSLLMRDSFSTFLEYVNDQFDKVIFLLPTTVAGSLIISKKMALNCLLVDTQKTLCSELDAFIRQTMINEITITGMIFC